VPVVGQNEWSCLVSEGPPHFWVKVVRRISLIHFWGHSSPDWQSSELYIRQVTVKIKTKQKQREDEGKPGVKVTLRLSGPQYSETQRQRAMAT